VLNNPSKIQHCYSFLQEQAKICIQGKLPIPMTDINAYKCLTSYANLVYV